MPLSNPPETETRTAMIEIRESDGGTFDVLRVPNDLRPQVEELIWRKLRNERIRETFARYKKTMKAIDALLLLEEEEGLSFSMIQKIVYSSRHA